MGKKYKQIIQDVDKAIEEIKAQGISIEPLNLAIAELKSHSDNIEAIENNIDAVKSEVITPIKTELDQNKKAGKFSIWGFYVGAFGLIVTAISLLYTSFGSHSENENSQISERQQISEINNSLYVLTNFIRGTNIKDTPNNIKGEKSIVLAPIELSYIYNSLTELTYYIHGLNGNYVPVKGEQLLNNDDRGTLVKNDSVNLYVKPSILAEEMVNGKYFPFVSLTFFTNGRKLNYKGLSEITTILNNSGVSHYNSEGSQIILTENDGFILFKKYRFEIKRIFRSESQMLTVGDNKNAVLITLIE